MADATPDPRREMSPRLFRCTAPAPCLRVSMIVSGVRSILDIDTDTDDDMLDLQSWLGSFAPSVPVALLREILLKVDGARTAAFFSGLAADTDPRPKARPSSSRTFPTATRRSSPVPPWRLVERATPAKRVCFLNVRSDKWD